MRMYRYVSAPFPLSEDVVATIKHDKDYLALDPSGTIGKELSLTEILACDHINRIYHCTGENVLQKNLDDLCLYNLFNQRVDQIEDLCSVEIGKVKSHAIQLSGNQFRILVTKPAQLTKICLDGNAQVETIEGVYILTLSDSCPKANTPDHIFKRNPHVMSSQQLITLPLMQTAAEWFDTIDNSFVGIDLKPVLEEVKSSREGPISIEVFRNQTEAKNTRFYKNIIDYVQLDLTAIAVTYAIYLLLKLLRIFNIELLFICYTLLALFGFIHCWLTPQPKCRTICWLCYGFSPLSKVICAKFYLCDNESAQFFTCRTLRISLFDTLGSNKSNKYVNRAYFRLLSWENMRSAHIFYFCTFQRKA